MAKKRSIEVAGGNKRQKLRRRVKSLLNDLDRFRNPDTREKVVARLIKLGTKNGLGENIDPTRANIREIEN